MKTIKAFAPATVANFIVGFDSLGASIVIHDELFGDIVCIEAATQQKVDIVGKYAQSLPKRVEDNIVSKCIQHFHDKLTLYHKQPQTFSLQLEKRLPVSSGLGSSASSIVAALIALNAFYDDIIPKQELLLMAGALEGVVSGSAHYDNVAPCLLGGLQLMIPHQLSQPLPCFDDWFIVLYYPGIAVSTKMAREILPSSLPLAQVVSYWQKFSIFIHALYQNDPNLALSMMNDNLIEPHRAKLIPHFETMRGSALKAGALTFGISGSGPTCFAIANKSEVAQAICRAIADNIPFSQNSFCKVGKISMTGARIIT